MAVLPVAAAPAQGRTGAGYVLTLDGEWKQGRLDRFGHTLGFAPERYIVPGMSGSLIVSAAGAALGVPRPAAKGREQCCQQALGFPAHVAGARRLTAPQRQQPSRCHANRYSTP